MAVAPATPPRLTTLILLSGLSVVSLNMFLPSLSNIAADFRADYGLVNLSVAGYLAATAVLQLVMGPLSDRYGRRPVILAGLAVFAAASLGCLLAQDIWTFLAFRLLQGAIISGYTVSLAVVRDSAPARTAASLMGYLAMGWAVAPMLAPLVGGALDELFGWRASFWLFLGFGLSLFVLCWFDLGETNKNPSQTLGEQARDYPALFASRRFWGYALCMAFSVGAFYAFLSAAPLVATSVFGITPATLGIVMGSITAGFILGSFLSGRFSSGHALTTMMIAGRAVALSGLALAWGFVAVGILHPVALFGSCVFVGIGNGITMPSSNAGAVSVRPALAGSAAGLSGALMVGGGAAISAVTGALLRPETAVYTLLGMMLAMSLLSLLAALYVRAIDRREGAPGEASTTAE